MKIMSKEELKETEVNILNYFDMLCKKHGLRYWLNYGTLIGAIRHKGQIPWDDDIDVSMFREDYDKLIEICRNNQSTRYRFHCVELDSDWLYSIGKMIDEETVLYELGEDGIKIGVFIDVFVYDGAPDGEKALKKAFDRLDFYRIMRMYQLPMEKAQFSFKGIINFIIKIIINLFPKQYFTRKIVETAKKNKNDNSRFVCDLTDPYYHIRWRVDKAIFEDLIDVEFEGKMYKAPSRYDEWLKLQYGDYMKIPSKEQQKVAQHTIVAYKMD